MIDLGQRVVENYVCGFSYPVGILVKLNDGLHKVTDKGLVWRYAHDGPVEREVMINGKTYFEVLTSAEKPPLGLEPQKYHDESRRDEIMDAIRRYFGSFKEIPLEWVDEYNEIISRYK